MQVELMSARSIVGQRAFETKKALVLFSPYPVLIVPWMNESVPRILIDFRRIVGVVFYRSFDMDFHLIAISTGIAGFCAVISFPVLYFDVHCCVF
jgi:hypothetical protein